MRRRRGGVLIYAMVAMTAFIAVISLSVDFGRVALTKTELTYAADSAARAAAAKLVSDPSNATNYAVYTAGLNSANGSSVVLVPASDITYGYWNDTTKVFNAGSTPTNSVRVIARRVSSRNTAVNHVFASLLGRTSTDVSATSIAAYLTDPVPNSVTNKSNPWLAGMPAGTTANSYDSAPSASPTLLINGGLTAGQSLQFAATGATSNQDGVESAYEPDGNLSWIIHNYGGAENGIANVKAPISALMGVFLSDAQPNTTAAPASLDFTTAASRDFSSISPALKQPFFIGDAKRANGAQQSFVIPAGATRLYVGSMDGQQWSDNGGGFSVTVTNGATIYRIATVK